MVYLNVMIDTLIFHRSEFAATVSPRYKDVVIVIDSSSSMKRPSLVADKSKFVLAKEAARYVIQTLNPNEWGSCDSIICFMCMFYKSLFVHLYFSFGHCIVCSSSIYGF
jgi:hypothetical protein